MPHSDMAQRCAGRLLWVGAVWQLVVGFAGAGLYSPGDQVETVTADTLPKTIYNSSTAWALEFYASWCGHCIEFAPVWKSLAQDIKEWKPAVSLAAIDCADSQNRILCKTFKVLFYPTIKFFKAFSKEPFQGQLFKEISNDKMQLRRNIIRLMETHKGDVWPPACPPLEPARIAEITRFFDTNDVQYLALIFEEEDSFLGREVTLDMLQYENIAVRRVLRSEESLVTKFGVHTFPSCYLYTPNDTFAEVTVRLKTRIFYTYYLRQLGGVTRGAYKLTVQDAAAAGTMKPWRNFDSSKVYMADLESALQYSLKVEVGMHTRLAGDSLAALNHYINMLVKLFPGRPIVINLLQGVQAWLADTRSTKHFAGLSEVLDNTIGLQRAALPIGGNWAACQGSRPQFRQYPCSLWILFHVLSVQAANYNESAAARGEVVDQLEVLHGLRSYVKNFFSCRYCATHFEAMAAESMEDVRTLDEAILWLWSRHNRVNDRLAGALSEDPKFPKHQWPSPDLCPECHDEDNEDHVWINDAVLKFLKKHYSMDNLDYSYLEPEYELLKKQVPKKRIDPEERGKGEQLRGGAEDVEEELKAEEKEGSDEEVNSNIPRDSATTRRLRKDTTQRRSIILGKHKHRAQEEDIVDLDNFVGQQYKSSALRATVREETGLAEEHKRRGQLHLQSVDDSEAIDYVAVQERVRKRDIRGDYFEGEDEPKSRQWLLKFGTGFSSMDISLCILLYLLTSICLLGMYLYFKKRIRCGWNWGSSMASA
eukprot:gi/632955954/ref/XP_007893719.1/ PREDICTED: sulfhydryl oxidase 1 [Callorhinchus milii]